MLAKSKKVKVFIPVEYEKSMEVDDLVVMLLAPYSESEISSESTKLFQEDEGVVTKIDCNSYSCICKYFPKEVAYEIKRYFPKCAITYD